MVFWCMPLRPLVNAINAAAPEEIKVEGQEPRLQIFCKSARVGFWMKERTSLDQRDSRQDQSLIPVGPFAFFLMIQHWRLFARRIVVS